MMNTDWIKNKLRAAANQAIILSSDFPLRSRNIISEFINFTTRSM